MNQIKIGEFIADCRKNKGLTQNQLAKKLGITDKAISKWENGKSMPDVSLFIPLCDILGISLNELLAGEHIDAQNLKEKSDEVLMEVMQNKKSNIRGLLVQIISSSIMCVGIVLFFVPSVKNLSKNAGIGVVAVGLLLLMIGLYGKIRFSQTKL